MKLIKLIALAALLGLAACKAAPPASSPVFSHTIYPDTMEAHADLAAALKTAAATHKRVLLDFGGNWCGDCLVLDLYFHDAANWPILESNFVLVDINVGHYDANLDLAQKYGIPLNKGVPALAVLSENGTLLYSQQSGQFEAMSHLQSSDVTTFLEQWRPAGHGCATTTANC
jgi:thiol:disulfide interchange protein